VIAFGGPCSIPRTCAASGFSFIHGAPEIWGAAHRRGPCCGRSRAR
jgi:hypothetical protein